LKTSYVINTTYTSALVLLGSVS